MISFDAMSNWYNELPFRTPQSVSILDFAPDYTPSAAKRGEITHYVHWNVQQLGWVRAPGAFLNDVSFAPDIGLRHGLGKSRSLPNDRR